MRVRLVLLLAIVAVCAALNLAQTSGGGGSAVGGAVSVASAPAAGTSFSGTFTTSTMQYNMPAITGAPYSGEQVGEQVQTLADGTHITRTMPSQRVWRDSQGRMRTERQMGMSMNGSAPRGPVMIEIRDPVAGVAYILEPAAKVAHRIKMQPMPTRPPAGAATVATPPPANITRPEMKTESLGNQVIEGVMAEGRRTTMTYPVGAMGNDRPLVRTSENWMSPELRVTLLSKSTDPQSGVNTTKLINVSRVEPDINLFRPPADYTIVDEAGPSVTIHYTTQ